jgi:hypothetical protein
VLLLASSSSRLAVFTANANHQLTGTPVAVIVEAISYMTDVYMTDLGCPIVD